MGTGTSAHGKKMRTTQMIRCRRCGKNAYHVNHKKCSSCGFGQTARMRSYAWQKK